MLERYLDALESKLSHYVMSEVERQEILTKYQTMIHSMQAEGKAETEIIEHLPTPKLISEELSVQFDKKKRLPFTDRLLSVSPFLMLLIYLYLGFQHTMWHPGWVLILALPGLAVSFEIFNDPDKNIVQAIIPLILLISFFVLGLGYSHWLTAWSLLLVVPFIVLFDSRRLKTNFLMTLSILTPFLTLFVILNLLVVLNSHPSIWTLALLNPLVWFTTMHNPLKKLLLIVTLLLITMVYLYIGFNFSEWSRGLFLFLILIPLLRDNPHMATVRSHMIVLTIVVLGSFTLFIYFAFAGYINASWLFFLLIPLTLQVLKQTSIREKLFASFPYFILSAFFILGIIYDAWHPGWIMLIIIPILYILRGKSSFES